MINILICLFVAIGNVGYTQFKIDKAPRTTISMAESPLAPSPAIIVRSYWTVASTTLTGNDKFYTAAFSLRKSRLNWELPVSFRLKPIPHNFWSLSKKLLLYPPYLSPRSS